VAARTALTLSSKNRKKSSASLQDVVGVVARCRRQFFCHAEAVLTESAAEFRRRAVVSVDPLRPVLLLLLVEDIVLVAASSHIGGLVLRVTCSSAAAYDVVHNHFMLQKFVTATVVSFKDIEGTISTRTLSIVNHLQRLSDAK